MSIRAIGWVLQNSRAKLGDRLVLLSIADCADDLGRNAWPSIPTIARKANLSRSQTKRSLQRLMITVGELAIQRGAGPNGTNIYRIVGMAPAGLFDAQSPERRGVQIGPPQTGIRVHPGALGAPNPTTGGSKMDPYPSSEPSREPEEEKRLVAFARTYANDTFRQAMGRAPTWFDSDTQALTLLLRQHRIQEFRRRWDFYIQSTEAFIKKQGYRLSYFCRNFDRFMDGPIHDRSNEDDKLSAAEERTRRNLKAAGLLPDD